MIVLTRTTGQKLLFEGRHEQAVPAAMQSLRFAIDVHGLASIELVPSYLILGEASIGMDISPSKHLFTGCEWNSSFIQNQAGIIPHGLALGE